jgi:hypothetical protein
MPLRKAFLVASTVWGWYATLAGIGTLALGVAYLVLIASSGTGQVFDVVAAKPLVTTAKPGGAISYTWTQDRHENCPGRVITRFSPIDSDNPSIIQTERPVAYTEAKLYKAIPVTIILPQSVTPGKWKLLDGVQSECLDRSRYDRIIEFDFTVTEPE